MGLGVYCLSFCCFMMLQNKHGSCCTRSCHHQCTLLLKLEKTIDNGYHSNERSLFYFIFLQLGFNCYKQFGFVKRFVKQWGKRKEYFETQNQYYMSCSNPNLGLATKVRAYKSAG